MSKFIMLYDRTGKKSVKVYQPSNVDETAKLGEYVEIGAFCEIETNVIIGDNVKIGALTYIESGVEIPDNTVIRPQSIVFKNLPDDEMIFKTFSKTITESAKAVGKSSAVFLPKRKRGRPKRS